MWMESFRDKEICIDEVVEFGCSNAAHFRMCGIYFKYPNWVLSVKEKSIDLHRILITTKTKSIK